MTQPPGLAKPALMESSAEGMPAKGLTTTNSRHELQQSSLATKAPSCREWMEDVLAGAVACYLTSLPVLLGLLFGAQLLRPLGVDAPIRSADPITACIHFDAVHYLEIARRGYAYDPDRGSPVAFFPAYPLIGRYIGQTTGLLPADAALLVTHTALLLAFILLLSPA